MVSVTWDASLLGVQDGSAVELRVFGDRSNGNPSVRRTVEVGAVEWVAATSATELAGLYYLRARYYHPETGRFLSSDPFGGITTMPLSQNGYPYVLANPVNLLDPSGMCVLGAYCPEPLKRAGEAIEDIGKGAAQIGEDLSYGIYVGSYETLQLLGHLPDEVEIALLPTEVVLTIVEADALWTAAALDYLATGNLLTSTTIPKRKAAVGGLAIGGRTRLTSGKDVTSLAPSSLGFPLVMIPSSGFTLTSNGPSVIDERDAALCAATQGI